jgi:hypothetical protein
MKQDLNELDPLPKLGSKVQTEVVYYHQEEKEIAPFLYEKDGKLRYAPPVPDQSAWPFPVSIADVKWEPVKADQVFQFFSVSEPQTFEFTTIADHWKAVEEEKQDNKPTIHTYIVRAADGGWKSVPVGEEGWISHTPGDPMPCDPEMRVSLKCDYRTHFNEDDYKDGVIEHNAATADTVAWDGAVVAWKPA